MNRRRVAVPALAICASLAVPAVAAGPAKVSGEGVGKVKLGAEHATLHAQGLLSRQRPGCELAGPDQRVARLRNAEGLATLTTTKPRRVAAINVTGGAKAKGVGIGDTRKDIRAAFPNARISNRNTIGFNIARIPKEDGGRFQFGIDVQTKKIAVIGVPSISFCE